MAGQGLLQSGHFVGGHVAGVVLPLVPGLQFVEGSGAGAAGLAAEFAAFHAGQGVHLLQDVRALLRVGHGKYLAD